MPHICIRCNTRLDAVEGLAPRCPACGGTKFSFVSVRRREEEEKEISPTSDTRPDDIQKNHNEEHEEENSNTHPFDSIESIRILEPGRYDLNLFKLAESDDRVIKVGKDANYRLDLSSMVRSKKKE